MAVVGQQLLAPEAGWRRYDNTHPHIKYNGTWSHNSTSGYYNGTHSDNSTLNDSYEFCFKGTSLRIIDGLASNRSANVTVTIDDNIVDSYSSYASTTTRGVLVYEKTGLDNVVHKVKVTNNATGYMTLDAIDVDGELVMNDYFENSHISYEPMRKYGVAWFGFDEASGNVYDKLGSNYVGTVTGATRVQGWNGEGSALKINGNQYVSMNNKIIPIEERTIRFKIKTSYKGGTQTFLDNCNSTSTTYGFCLYLSEKGFIGSNTVRNVGTWDAIFPTLQSDVSINDGKWHSVMLTWNGKINGEVNLYIDDVLSCKVIAKSNDVTPSYNLMIGRLVNQSANLFYGEIDDFQVYSKVLTPSDFIQNNVAIKTTDNKILTLPNREGRVKELPTAEEVDLINQAYTWREIDNAVDGGINLTQTTTEYEIVSKTNSTLGSGKMFTIPVDDFKTIKIEGNY